MSKKIIKGRYIHREVKDITLPDDTISMPVADEGEIIYNSDQKKMFYGDGNNNNQLATSQDILIAIETILEGNGEGNAIGDITINVIDDNPNDLGNKIIPGIYRGSFEGSTYYLLVTSNDTYISQILIMDGIIQKRSWDNLDPIPEWVSIVDTINFSTLKTNNNQDGNDNYHGKDVSMILGDEDGNVYIDTAIDNRTIIKEVPPGARETLKVGTIEFDNISTDVIQKKSEYNIDDIRTEGIYVLTPNNNTREFLFVSKNIIGIDNVISQVLIDASGLAKFRTINMDTSTISQWDSYSSINDIKNTYFKPYSCGDSALGFFNEWQYPNPDEGYCRINMIEAYLYNPEHDTYEGFYAGDLLIYANGTWNQIKCSIPITQKGTVGGVENYIAVANPNPTTKYWRGDKTWQVLDKTAIGVPHIDDTSDLDKPVSTEQQRALDGARELDKLGITGAATSDGTILITLDGLLYGVAVTSGMTINQVAAEIRDSEIFILWELTGTNQYATFQKRSVGVCSAPAFNGNGTGVTGSFEIVRAGTYGKADLDDEGKVPYDQLPLLISTPVEIENNKVVVFAPTFVDVIDGEVTLREDHSGDHILYYDDEGNVRAKMWKKELTAEDVGAIPDNGLFTLTTANPVFNHDDIDALDDGRWYSYNIGNAVKFAVNGWGVADDDQFEIMKWVVNLDGDYYTQIFIKTLWGICRTGSYPFYDHGDFSPIDWWTYSTLTTRAIGAVNGIAGLNEDRKLEQMPTAADVGALANDEDAVYELIGIPNPQPNVAVENLVTYGSFEAGTAVPTGWTENNSSFTGISRSVSTEDKIDGDKSFKAVSNGTNTSANNYRLEQTLTTTSGHIYYVSCWFKSSVVGKAGLKVGSSATQYNTTTEWEHIKFRYTATGATALIVLYGATANANTAVTTYIDGCLAIDLTAAYGAGNEPATTSIDAYLLSKYPSTMWFDGESVLPRIDLYNGKALAVVNGVVKMATLDEYAIASQLPITDSAGLIAATTTEDALKELKIGDSYLLTNLITNPLMTSTTGWVGGHATLAVSDGEMIATGLGDSKDVVIEQLAVTALTAGDKYELRAKFRDIDGGSTKFTILAFGSGGTNLNPTVQSSPVQGTNYNYTYEFTVTNQTGNLTIYFISTYANAGAAAGKTWALSNVELINKTAAFTAGNEAQAAYLRHIIDIRAGGVFSGSKVFEHFNDKLQGSTIVCLGDSITALGHYTDNLRTMTKATVLQCGVGGTRMTGGADANYSAFSAEALATAYATGVWTAQDTANATLNLANYNTIKNTDLNDADYMVLWFGTNDYGGNTALADFTDAINDVIDTLLTAFPHLRIMFVTPMWRQRFAEGDNNDSDTYQNSVPAYLIDYVNAVVTTANANHIPVFNAYSNMGITKYNHTTYLSDGLHPNATGDILSAQKIWKAMDLYI